ncbi:MAG: glutamine synthetase, partial [Rhodobacteraceae bacterium]|nr:glutamine synthetase [Paracoccaceae bacterium]
EPAVSGDIYHARQAREIPHTLGEAADLMTKSKMLRAAFGDDVVDHYTRAARWEIEEQNRVVTDWEVKRGFERL